MTREDIKKLVLSADPDAQRFFSDKKGKSFTVYGEYRRTSQSAEDRHDYGWRFEIDRFTTDPDDPVADRIEEALINHPGVTYTYEIGFDHASGYIRHIFDCEGI